MKAPRTKSTVVGVLLFIFGFLACLFVSFMQIKDSINYIVKTEIQKYTKNDWTVRGKIQNDITAMRNQIDALAAGIYSSNKNTPENREQNIHLFSKLRELEDKIKAMDTTSEKIINFTSEPTQVQIDKEFTDKAEEAEQFIVNHIQQLEDDYFYESQDTHWAGSVSDKINQSIARYQEQTQISTSVISMDCKTTLCRLELARTHGDNPGLFELSLLHSLGDEIGESSSQTIKDENGNIYSTVYYLARRGYSVARN